MTDYEKGFQEGLAIGMTFNMVVADVSSAIRVTINPQPTTEYIVEGSPTVTVTEEVVA